jgi:hypothetical protein
VNPINHFELNRPVHLARRDVYFEKAVELISNQQPTHGETVSIEVYEHVLYMLRIARQHAEFSIRREGLPGHDEQFRLFINLLAGNVKAVLSMMNLKGMVESSGGSSFSFLGMNQASAGLQAEEYQRRANDIVRSIQNTLRLAQEPLENLKAENRETATDEENARYKRARKHYLQLVGKDPSVSRIPAIFRRILRT